jgi:hypothetical protein
MINSNLQNPKSARDLFPKPPSNPSYKKGFESKMGDEDVIDTCSLSEEDQITKYKSRSSKNSQKKNQSPALKFKT